MSLIEGRWAALAAAGILALAVPIKLVGGAEVEVPHRPARTVTAVEVSDPGTLAFAFAAPPFTLGRTPAAAEPPTMAAAPVEAAAPPAPPPSLVGLVVGGRGRAVALFRTASGTTVTLSRGQAVDGWTVLSIGREQALLERESARHRAVLDFRNRSAADASAPAPSSPPPSPTPQSPAPDRNAS